MQRRQGLFPATQPGSALLLPMHLRTMLTPLRSVFVSERPPEQPLPFKRKEGQLPQGPAAVHSTSSLCETKERVPGSRLEVAKTSLSSTSFFSRTSRSPFSLRSRSKFLNPVFCCTSLMALVNFW